MEFLENGSTAGLTKEELEGIKKVDELLALNKINYQDILEIRNSNNVLKGGSKTKAFDIVEYGDKTPGLENHHGVFDVWATHNIDGYKSRASESTTIALTQEQHAATKSVYRDWLYERTDKKVGGKVDWTSISSREIQAANVPASVRYGYYREFNCYIYGLEY